MDLIEVLDRIKAARPRVLVVGDNIRDVYRHVEFVRFTDEGGERRPIYRTLRTEAKEGGAAAVALMCEGLGAEVVRDYGPRRSIKERLLCDGKLIGPRVDFDEAWPVPQKFPAFNGADAVLIADYAKGGCTPGLLCSVIESGEELGVPVLVDPARGVSWERYQGATVIKANFAEWDAAAYYNSATWDRDWNKRADWIVRTDGLRGMDVIQRGSQHWETFPTEPIEPLDVTGAGDMVLAVLGVCLAAGIELPEACRLANVAAGLKCRKLGAVPVTLGELREHLQRCEAQPTR